MKWNPFILAVALAFPLAAQAQEAKCPSYQGKAPLTAVSVFDGPPSKKADLVPDVTRGAHDLQFASWDVSYLATSARGLYLVCKYEGAGTASVTIKVENKAKSCVFRAHPAGQPAEASCK